METEADVHSLVRSVANKQQANKRKRDPDMYLDAVLECTVRRLNRERMEREEVSRKRRRTTSMVCGGGSIDTDNDSQHYDNNPSMEFSSRPFMNESDVESNNCDEMDRELDEQLSGDLKELLDELAREFPGDFWLNQADSNNNNNSNNNNASSRDATTDFQTDEQPNDDLWLLSMIEILCSS